MGEANFYYFTCLKCIHILYKSCKMAKSKNYSHHNQNRKNHRNGIKKPKTHRHASQDGMDRKFLKNLRFSKRNNKLGKAKVRAQNERQWAESCEEGRHYGIVANGDELFLTMPLKSVVIFLFQHPF